MDRADLPTPVLILDRAAMDRNIAAMAGFAAARGLALRPHAKTHKSAEIARRQISAGAAGICCAKLAEAEALAAEGITDIHLTSPVVRPDAIARLVALNGRIALSLVADHPENVAALARAATRPLTVFIDVDPGAHRTGVASPEAALALADAIAAEPNLRLGGVQYYCGSQQHIESRADRFAAVERLTAYLASVLDMLKTAGHAIPIVTGAGTGTFAIDAELGVLTELQCGSYIFLDREYEDCELTGGGAPVFERALFLDATVISANHATHVTLDAGLKAMATDAGPPRPIRPGATYRFTGDEHGALIADSLPKLGERVTLQPPHCDPTVNLHDAYRVVEGDRVVDCWTITARGRGT
ncbi:DSD1 family PLP-dependent enzyme [Sphingomonas sp. G-3-2-10]|uniref:DSD1 family PLP-dependent enzyme n=1 Tax=Sphingomonas sp. G-3-2-10 TaxID=2728838 RepID=UPI00146F5BF6|nr:DSD1 family PLP-dependent enzyme [Sphingomonas sp. G-3-2-10]NML07879.1 DSD1 family PLP-dependent enzyme [Sphingomonas sp. G-3-2-10]